MLFRLSRAVVITGVVVAVALTTAYCKQQISFAAAEESSPRDRLGAGVGGTLSDLGVSQKSHIAAGSVERLDVRLANTHELRQVWTPSPPIAIAVSSKPNQIMDAETFKAHQARNFYEIASQCEQRGDMAMARNCYEEATRVAPDSAYGKLAGNRLAVITVAAIQTAGHSGVELQEEPPVKKEPLPEERMDVVRLVESWRMLQLGEGYRVSGDLDNAFRCFQDAHAICPSSRYGKAAHDRMIEVERARTEKRPQLNQRQRHDGVEEQQAPMSRRSGYSDIELQQRDRAHELFVLAERHMADGDLRMAYNLFQETHLAFPDCYYGMCAIERMQELETRRIPLRKNDNR